MTVDLYNHLSKYVYLNGFRANMKQYCSFNNYCSINCPEVIEIFEKNDKTSFIIAYRLNKLSDNPDFWKFADLKSYILQLENKNKIYYIDEITKLLFTMSKIVFHDGDSHFSLFDGFSILVMSAILEIAKGNAEQVRSFINRLGWIKSSPSNYLIEYINIDVVNTYIKRGANYDPNSMIADLRKVMKISKFDELSAKVKEQEETIKYLGETIRYLTVSNFAPDYEELVKKVKDQDATIANMKQIMDADMVRFEDKINEITSIKVILNKNNADYQKSLQNVNDEKNAIIAQLTTKVQEQENAIAKYEEKFNSVSAVLAEAVKADP